MGLPSSRPRFFPFLYLLDVSRIRITSTCRLALGLITNPHELPSELLPAWRRSDRNPSFASYQRRSKASSSPVFATHVLRDCGRRAPVGIGVPAVYGRHLMPAPAQGREVADPFTTDAVPSTLFLPCLKVTVPGTAPPYCPVTMATTGTF